jgi:cytochrome b561
VIRLFTISYTRTAIALHWVIFALIACGFTLGHYMVGLPFSPMKLKFFSWHKWLGVTVFMLAIVRIVWRGTHPPPPAPPSMPEWQKTAAGASHLMLYVFIVIIPLSGWFYSSAAGIQTVYLGLIPIPNLLHKDKPLSEFLKQIHELLNNGLAVLVAIHVAAALKHCFIDRDAILRRMLPFLPPRELP